MIGFFSLKKDGNEQVTKDKIYFVSVPEGLPEQEIKDRMSPIAQGYANFFDTNIVYLLYGKDKFIKYEYSI